MYKNFKLISFSQQLKTTSSITHRHYAHKVHGLTVGPIVGATSDSTCRIWGRGQHDKKNKKNHCLAVARVKPSDSTISFPKQLYHIINMKPHFDWTGVPVFQNLQPTTKYDYEMGYIHTGKDAAQLLSNRIPELDWSRASKGSFQTTTGSGSSDHQLQSYVFGSCRYFLRFHTLGMNIWENRSDRTFKSMYEMHKNNKDPPLRAVLMLGDQIYADDLNRFHDDDDKGDYRSRYRTAFGTPYFSQLASHVPTYMTLDDHEIQDNWPASASHLDWVSKYPDAMQALLSYQFSHSPLFSINQAQNRIEGKPKKLWYTFSDGCCEFFMMDTRTERILARNPDDPERKIISQTQMDGLKEWLVTTADKTKVKFIASSVPVFPDLKSYLYGMGSSDRSLDKWSGFSHQRTELLDFIQQNQISRLVFLSGDVHCSLASQLRVKQDNDRILCTSVISSPFFWPYRLSNENFHLNGDILPTNRSPNHNNPFEYQVDNSTKIIQDDNFTKITVNPLDTSKLDIQVYSRKGHQLNQISISLL